MLIACRRLGSMKILFGICYFGRRCCSLALLYYNIIQFSVLIATAATDATVVVSVIHTVIIIIYLFYVIVNEFTRVLTIDVSGLWSAAPVPCHIESFDCVAVGHLPSIIPFNRFIYFSFILHACGRHVRKRESVSISLDKMDNRQHSMCVCHGIFQSMKNVS